MYGATSQQFHDYLEAEDVGMAVVKFKNGAVGTIEGTTQCVPEESGRDALSVRRERAQ